MCGGSPLTASGKHTGPTAERAVQEPRAEREVLLHATRILSFLAFLTIDDCLFDLFCLVYYSIRPFSF